MGGRFDGRRRRRTAAYRVGDALMDLLPGRGESLDAFVALPLWPPDVFAVAATLVSRSGCYAATRPESVAGPEPFGAEFTERASYYGQLWSTDPENSEAAEHLAALWKVLVDGWELALVDQQPYGDVLPELCRAALELMSIADEASRGIGFSPPEDGLPFSWWHLNRTLRGVVAGDDDRDSTPTQRNRTATVCLEVPADRACVQPKTRSPHVGCTMRSLSKNLALLPPVTEIRTQWLTVPEGGQASFEPLNILLVPFPFHISGRDFRAQHVDDRGWGMFGLSPDWQPKSPKHFANFLKDLAAQSRREVAQLDGILMPELALSEDFARRVADELASERGLEFFITGVQSKGERGSSSKLAPARSQGRHRNLVAGHLYGDSGRLSCWLQAKHHRWKLDPAQSAIYSLGDALSPGCSWWEDIDIANRELTFYQVRNRASLAVLICEDLARLEPVQSVVRAVGPSLVVALLMDGAQLAARWPGRYATVLAEDPGSSVLTLTSMGMVERGSHPRLRPSRSIALWRDAHGRSEELELARGDHGLLLTLSPQDRRERSMDGRDHDDAVEFQLTGVRGIRADDEPAWLYSRVVPLSDE